MKKSSTTEILKSVLIYAFLGIIFFFSVFPFIFVLIGTTNKSDDVLRGKLTIGSHLIENFQKLFSLEDFLTIILNSFFVSIMSVLCTLIISSMAAYGFEMYKSKARSVIYSIMLFTMMIPFSALMIPLYKLMISMDLQDDLMALILPSATSVFMIFFFKQSFVSFPREIIQAARMDGAGEFKIFFRIVIPSMKSTYAAAAIYSFMISWNAYLWPLIIIKSNDTRTFTLLLANLSSAYFQEYGVLMAAIVVSILPSIILFFGLQNYFVKGILGSIKQ